MAAEAHEDAGGSGRDDRGLDALWVAVHTTQAHDLCLHIIRGEDQDTVQMLLKLETSVHSEVLE